MEVKRMKWEQKLEVGDDLPKTEVIVWAENISFSHLGTFHAVKWLQNERGCLNSRWWQLESSPGQEPWGKSNQDAPKSYTKWHQAKDVKWTLI